MEHKNDNGLEVIKQHAAESFWREVFNQKNQSYSNYDPTIKSLFPRCDMYEKENYLYINIELPGISQDDVSIYLKDQNLCINGKYSTFQSSLQYYLKEREDRSFERTINLPVKVNNLKLHCNFEHGLLTIRFPIIKEDDAVPININLHAKTHIK